MFNIVYSYKYFIIKAFFLFFSYRIFDPTPGFFSFFLIISFGNNYFIQIFSCFLKKMTTILLGTMSKIHKSVYPWSKGNYARKSRSWSVLKFFIFFDF